MLKSASKQHFLHSSPQIDTLFHYSKSHLPTHNHSETQTDQMKSIRTLADELDSQQNSGLDKSLSCEATDQIQNEPRSKCNIYRKGQAIQRKALEGSIAARICQSVSQPQLKLAGRHGVRKPINYNKSHLTKRQSCLVQSLLANCINEQNAIRQLANFNKKTPKKDVAKQEIDQIFISIHDKSSQVCRRKQAKIAQNRQEQYQRQMQGVVFYPQLLSSARLRKGCNKSFEERLLEDSTRRQIQHTQIIKRELQRDPFSPQLNHHYNTHTKSKINSLNSLHPADDFNPKEHRKMSAVDPRSSNAFKIKQPSEISLNIEELHFLF